MTTGIAWLRYAQDRLAFKNVSTTGIIRFNCPLCGERRGRGWIGNERGSAGCHNGGCAAHERLRGGAVELVARLDGHGTTGEAYFWLREHFPGDGPALAAPVEHTTDLQWPGVPLRDLDARRFMRTQWGLRRPLACATEWELHWGGSTGEWKSRILFPILEYGQRIAFTGRIVGDGWPRYKASSPATDGGAALHDCVFGIDRVMPGQPVTLVEGPGDVLACAAHFHHIAVCCFGTQISAAQAAKLAQRQPSEVIVALDADSSAKDTVRVLDACRAFGLTVRRGEWWGAKDPGEGARLRRGPQLTTTKARVTARLPKPRKDRLR